MKKVYDEVEIYREIYPECFSIVPIPIPRFSLDEIRLRDFYSEVAPDDVDLGVIIGPVKLNFGFLSAAMDTVSGASLAKVMFETGACGIIYRHKDPEIQLQWASEVISHKPCLISSPFALKPRSTLEKAFDIHDEYGFSTIPIVDENNILKGILFTKDASKDHPEGKIEDWMKPINNLKRVNTKTDFESIRGRLLNEKACTTLPVIDDDEKFHGIYFRKDCRPAFPSFHNGRPLVGIAISDRVEDLERVKEALDIGVGIIVIDSSHGNCPNVIKQAEKVVKMAEGPNGKAAVIAGNIGSIDGYNRLADAGVDAVKVGIGGGSICTTSLLTGVGTPLFSTIRELSFMRKKRDSDRLNAPLIIPDGGINNTGQYVIAVAAGGIAPMAGKWLAAAKESLSAERNHCQKGDWVYYRGMASLGAIKTSTSIRYGPRKKAPEGVEGYVKCQGALKEWVDLEKELIRGGYAHVGARNTAALQEKGDTPSVFSLVSFLGQVQMQTRIQN